MSIVTMRNVSPSRATQGSQVKSDAFEPWISTSTGAFFGPWSR